MQMTFQRARNQQKQASGSCSTHHLCCLGEKVAESTGPMGKEGESIHMRHGEVAGVGSILPGAHPLVDMAPAGT